MSEPEAQKEDRRPKGMAAFTVIWLGQLVSVLGSAMTQFALMIWIWEETGQATAMALMGFFTFLPMACGDGLAGRAGTPLTVSRHPR